MSNLSRIEILQTYAEQEPSNPFNWYALAIEYRNVNPEKALDYFNKLLTEHKVYLPTYYHAALLYAEMDHLEQAKNIYENGIALAKELGNQHALSELQNSYQNFLIEYDLI